MTGQRVEHAAEPRTKFAGLIARRCRGASRPLRLEVECLQDRRRQAATRLSAASGSPPHCMS